MKNMMFINSGSECVELFQKMSECMSQHPDLYPMRDDDDDDEDSEKIDEALQQLADTKTKEVTTEQSENDTTEEKTTDNNSVTKAEAKSWKGWHKKAMMNL